MTDPIMPNNPDPTRDPSTAPGATPASPAPVKPRKRRWFLKTVLVIVGLLIALVLLGPTIASTSPVRNFVAGKISEQLNGTATIGAWSIGWLSGVRMNDVKISDLSGQTVIDIQEVRTQLRLIDAIRGNLDLGETVVEVRDFNVVIDESGSSNLQRLPRAQPDRSPPASEPGELPNVRGNITVNFQGSVSGAGIPEPLKIHPSTAKLTVRSVREEIASAIRLAVQVGSNATGSITINGTSQLSQDGRLDVEKIRAAQTIELAGVDAASLNALMRTAGQSYTTTGTVSGKLDVSVAGLSNVSAKGAIDADAFTLSGGAIKGADRLSFRQIQIPIDVAVSQKEGQRFIDVRDTAVIVDGGKVARIDLRANVPQSTLMSVADLVPTVVEQLTGGSSIVKATVPVTGDGSAEITVFADMSVIAAQLRETLQVVEGVTIASGTVNHKTTIEVGGGNTVVRSDSTIENVAGTSGGTAIRLSPIRVGLASTISGAERSEIRDVNIDVSSGFANARGGGASLSKLKIQGDFDLARLQAELGQFLNLNELINPETRKPVAMSGTGSFELATDGDLLRDAGGAAVSLTSQLRNIEVRGIGELPPVVQENVAASLRGTLVRSSAPGSGPVRAWKDLALTLTSMRGASEKVIELLADADVDVAGGAVTRFELTRLSVPNLPLAQRQVEPFVPAFRKAGINFTSGSLEAVAGGSYVDGRLALTKPLALTARGMTVHLDEKVLLTNETLDVQALADIRTADGSVSGTISQLSMRSSSNLFNASKSDSNIEFTFAPGRALSGNGALDVTADLQRITEILQRLQAAPPNQTPTEGAIAQLRSGMLSAKVTMSTSADQSRLELNGKIDRLTVVTGRETIENETVNLTGSVVGNADFTEIVPSLTVRSNMLTATVSDAKVRLDAGTWDMVRTATVEINSRDLPRLHRIYNAFAPQTPPPAGSATEPWTPLEVMNGRMNVRATVAGAGSGAIAVSVQDLSIQNLDLRRGRQRFQFGDRSIAVKIDAEVAGQSDPTGAVPFSEQFRSLRVTALNGNLGIAQLSMAEPVVVTGPLSRLAAAGKVQLAGELQDAMRLLQVLQNAPEPSPFAGAYSLTPTVSTAGNLVTLKLVGTVNDFVVATENAPPKQQVSLDGTILLDTAAQTVRVDTFKLSLPQTNALSVDTSGAVYSLADSIIRMDGVKLAYSYDLEKVFPIVLPMLAPETREMLAGTVVEGKLSRELTLSGAYDASKPFHEAVRTLSGQGSFEITLLNTLREKTPEQTSGSGLRSLRNTLGAGPSTRGADSPYGVQLARLSIPFKMERGVVTLLDAQSASLNAGELNLSGIQIDLTDETPRLSIPQNRTVINRMSINPVLGDTLGKYINPIFPNSERSKGLITLKVERADRVALRAEKLGMEDSGSARILLTLEQMDIANPLGSLLLGPLIGAFKSGFEKSQANVFRGEIRDAVITLDRGSTTQDVKVSMIQDVPTRDPQTNAVVTRPQTMILTFQGQVALSDFRQRLNVSIPPQLIASMINLGDRETRDMERMFPNGFPVALRGTTFKPEVDAGQIVRRIAEAQAQLQLQRLLEGNRNRDRDEPPRNQNDRQPQNTGPQNPPSNPEPQRRETDRERELRERAEREQRKREREERARSTQPANPPQGPQRPQ